MKASIVIEVIKITAVITLNYPAMKIFILPVAEHIFRRVLFTHQVTTNKKAGTLLESLAHKFDQEF